jgi:cell division protein FtsI (penicillin-binding protein 3)
MLTELKKGRLLLVYSIIILIFLLIIFRMVSLVLFSDRTKVSGIYDVGKLSKRADIVDRNGVLVATDLKTKSLFVSTVLVKNSSAIAKSLSKTFEDLPYEEVFNKIREKKKSWILIKRNITPNQERQVRNLKIAGLLFQDDRVRIYPQKSIFSHLVGYVDSDRKGLSGIEMQYNKKLSEEDGAIVLSTDIRVQDILNNELSSGIVEFRAKAAFGVVLDINTGEVLGLSSLPSFDPNLQNQASQDERFNRVTNGVYEPGSIFKIFTNAMAFDENLIKVSDTFNVSEPIKYGRFTIKDYHRFNGRMTVDEIFSHSSNIGTVQVAQKIGIEKQKSYLKKFGMLDKLNIDFPGLGRPIYPKLWRDINLYTISYGHGIAVTPLHIAAIAGAMANGGTLYQPSFLKTKKAEGKRIVSEETSATMKKMLRTVVAEGTGKNANIKGYEIGGKTGTSNKAEGGRYNEKQTIASFVGAFPMSNPRYLVYVGFDRPNYSFNTGGMVAAPVAGRIISGIAPILGIKPQSESSLPCYGSKCEATID